MLLKGTIDNMVKLFDFLRENPETIFSLSEFSILLLAVLTTIIYLVVKTNVKKSIETQFNKKIETHKDNLKQESDLKLERIKLDLTKENIKFSILHEKRSEIIANVYSTVKELYDLLSIQLDEPDMKRSYDIKDNLDKLYELYSKKGIYLPQKIINNLDIIEDRLSLTSFHYNQVMNGEYDEIHFKYGKKIFSEMDALLANLENEFRILLGYED
jgi:hypothetical protein